ncbi:phosphoribosylformylglycinamidine synthase I [Rubidibacter lacunae KORDI 51-2]|uniref:Phosphoribosylformylglycinamidine synthase subunit PurQ n=1 Tax=Rubidibacter lacunae KORDI 51-2 TaxID=582515 RepID=U5D6C9_9CHRO|nr:phosphoribosylformylglycinamidine synthase subunit PurQ [Rubidibacter lacunae]ERN40198.1 phosphoribosylformylglycinamidine synthase I [Rubidibacter lacunae KORDI 51-2]
MKFGVIVFPGSNCDRDAIYVLRDLLGQPTRAIWHQEIDVDDLDAIVIPGGFSYGDYLRCGAIARFSPVMNRVIEHAERGKFVLGICNGFQVLTEAGLLPGALVRNRDRHFICDRVSIRVESDRSPWTRAYRSGQVIELPIAHGEGRYYADAETLQALEDEGRVLLRYCTPVGKLDASGNHNGSCHNIAGITNRAGNVLGMMPHPERASDPILGNNHGRALFTSLLANSAIA